MSCQITQRRTYVLFQKRTKIYCILKTGDLFQNIRLISGILNFTIDQDLEGIALFIDFEKAFDSLKF